MSTTLLIILNVTMSLLAFGTVAAGLLIARHLGPGPQDRWDHAYRRRSDRRRSPAAAHPVTRAMPRRPDLLGLR